LCIRILSEIAAETYHNLSGCQPVIKWLAKCLLSLLELQISQSSDTFTGKMLFETDKMGGVMTEVCSRPVCRSEGSFRSLWNTYSIYEDRIELEFRLFFTTITVRRNEFVSVDIFRPPVIRTSWGALKLDCADFYVHVGIVRNNGYFKELRFTPEDPRAFKEAVLKWAQA